MATFLKPEKTITTSNGLKILQKIIPDNLVATKDVASWVKKGQKMKPCKKLNNTGTPLGITVHNTNMIKVAKGTNAAEQYARATYDGNMGGVVVHFYVWEDIIWQLLGEMERGWHATDGQSRRKSQRSDGSKIGGNLDTIAIECIGNDEKSEETTAKLVAYLCNKYNLNPMTDVYQHNYFYPSKKCPQYIIPHWATFLKNVQKHYDLVSKKQETNTTTPNKAPSSTTSQDKNSMVEKKKYKKGDIVQFKGTRHFIGSASNVGSKCKSGKAKITNIKEGSKHPYHLIRVSGGGATVYGWVNVEDIE